MDNLFEQPIFTDYKNKIKFLLNVLAELTSLHYSNCREYKSLIDSQNIDINSINDLVDIPFIHVKLFKKYDLLSIKKDEIFKITTSSGTSGNAVSKIYLDKQTSNSQSKVLTAILKEFIPKRRPILIIDSNKTISSRNNFSARTAAVLGFAAFGRSMTFALDDDLTPNFDRINEFYGKFKNQEILIFGFTFLIYKFIKKVKHLDFKNAILFHGGGWKKMQDEMVDKETFNRLIKESFGLSTNVHDYYGMIEQTGSIYVECSKGYLHSTVFSEVLIRNPIDFSEVPFGSSGIVQVLSTIPKSYPGHSILTEDIGIIHGIDDCKCGRKGTYFEIIGRLKSSEIRGCSDTI
jgi:phenylacetate-coenzyme A ligase PaaK-like adenylate-forming protein